MIGYILSKFPDRRPNASNKIHCKCPFHDDRNPSFSIDLNKGLFICGSAKCGVRGNFFLFYKLMEGLTWGEVYERLGKRTPRGQEDIGEVPFSSLHKTENINETVNEFPIEPFVEPIVNLEYLNSRNLGKEVVDAFGMKYGKCGEFDGIDISNSIVSPVFDLDGSYVTFQVRYLDENRKMRWKNPRNSRIQNILYGGWMIGDPGDLLWVVEGASDVWNLYNHGMKAVGLFTKEASSGQLNRIYNLCHDFDMTPVSFLDGDANKNNHILADEMSALGLKVETFDLPGELDPGGLRAEELNEIKSRVEENLNV